MGSNTPSDWVFTLLLFNTLLFLLLSNFATSFADYEIIEERQENSLLPNFVVTLVVGLNNAPVWLNAILGLQILFTIYLLIVAFTGGG